MRIEDLKPWDRERLLSAARDRVLSDYSPLEWTLIVSGACHRVDPDGTAREAWARDLGEKIVAETLELLGDIEVPK